MPLRFVFLVLFFISPVHVFSQEKQHQERKAYQATRIADAPQIDGIPNDEVWKNLPLATNFVMVEPGDGKPSRPTHPTKVKLAYNNEAIFILASLYDPDAASIQRIFTQRDDIPVADYFMVDINTYNDGENQTRFLVTAAGTLADAKMKGESEDYAYDVVWDAKVHYDTNAWHVEIKIPYSALRFPDQEEQLWGIQFGRNINDLNEKYVWNYIDKSVGKSTHYNGLLTGIENVKAPVRLSFYPYISSEVDRYNQNNDFYLNAGMDFKYGISDAFTLDVTLIPDFSQTAYDEVELNLGPFEQTFDENRAFFTEGVELFTKGDLFYSRRIGDTPTGYDEATENKTENEEILENPEQTGLLNAIKISGRTKNGLGIGFLNAITKEEEIIYRNEVTGEIREIVSEPLANYNIFVLDQQLDQKSSVSLINTNVSREGHFRDGNVSGFLFDVYNNSSSYNFSGEAKMSRVNYASSNRTGFSSFLSVDRTKGKFRYGLAHRFANSTYDINDLGLNFINNYNNFFGNISYRIFEPQGIFNEYSIRLYGNHERRYDPDVYLGSEVGVSFFGITRERFAFGGSAEMNTSFKDFFEPRREGYFIDFPKSGTMDGWISSDYRKRFALDAGLSYRIYEDWDTERLFLRFEPRFRISNKFLILYSLRYTNEQDLHSFAGLLPKKVIFGERDRQSLENSFRGSYNFNTRQALNLSFRNFWSVAEFAPEGFSTLQKNGSLEPVAYEINEDNNPDANFNIWNLDLSYQWRFAPGSEMILLYRNSLFQLSNESELNYTESLQELFDEDLRQNLSLRIVYYLDYLSLKNIFKT